MTARGVFITGTDTGVGKTSISLALLHGWQSRGENVVGMKPVATGARSAADGLRNADAEALLGASNIQAAYDDINPYVFAPPIAPHLAAAASGTDIEVGVIDRHYRGLAGRADRVAVEGIGGWLVPLSGAVTVADLAARLGIPVLLVVALRLGCLNHAALTVAAMRSAAVPLAGWVANSVTRETPLLAQTVAALGERIDAPMIGCVPYQSRVSAAVTASALDFALLDNVLQ